MNDYCTHYSSRRRSIVFPKRTENLLPIPIGIPCLHHTPAPHIHATQIDTREKSLRESGGFHREREREGGGGGGGRGGSSR